MKNLHVGHFVVGFIVFIILVVGCKFLYKEVVAHNRAQKTKSFASALVHSDLSDLPDSHELTACDFWGKPLQYQRLVGKNQITHVVSSAGRDGIFDTSDDIIAKNVDNNYSKIIGSTIMDQAVEFGKGLKEGWGHKNQFEKTDEQRK